MSDSSIQISGVPPTSTSTSYISPHIHGHSCSICELEDIKRKMDVLEKRLHDIEFNNIVRDRCQECGRPRHRHRHRPSPSDYINVDFPDE